jgi:hypothetical protein
MVEDHIVRYKQTSNKIRKMTLDNKLNKKKKQQTNLYHFFQGSKKSLPASASSGLQKCSQATMPECSSSGQINLF